MILPIDFAVRMLAALADKDPALKLHAAPPHLDDQHVMPQESMRPAKHRGQGDGKYKPLVPDI